MNWTKIMECVPNFSEGRDLQKIDEIVSPFRAKAGVKLLDYRGSLRSVHFLRDRDSRIPL